MGMQKKMGEFWILCLVLISELPEWIKRLNFSIFFFLKTISPQWGKSIFITFVAYFAASRRLQAARWLESLVGPLGISSQPSERDFISCLRSGLILCNAINKINPGAVPKVQHSLFYGVACLPFVGENFVYILGHINSTYIEKTEWILKILFFLVYLVNLLAILSYFTSTIINRGHLLKSVKILNNSSFVDLYTSLKFIYTKVRLNPFVRQKIMNL